MAHCPKCKSHDIRRSPTRSRWERWRKEITRKRPYRCRACQWRGWLPIGLGDGEQARAQSRSTVPDPPNLHGTVLARQDAPLRMDFKELDRFHTRNEKDG